MSFESKIKYQYLKLLFDKLELKKIEDYLMNKKVIPKKIQDSNKIKISSYFFLQNKINLNTLNKEELELLKKYLRNDIEFINSEKNEMYNEMNDFLLKNMKKILLPNTEQRYISYNNSFSPFDLVCSDSICFYCHYLQYNDKSSDEANKIVCEIANYMQYELSKKVGIKLAVIPCNEVSGLNFGIPKV